MMMMEFAFMEFVDLLFNLLIVLLFGLGMSWIVNWFVVIRIKDLVD